ncbi:MAG: hypothetical protein CFE38_06175 [Comamonadaceae bacterium PBBC1]|nr:MAG: hypothetical protein CFE38_06175 [Comamonadaceae bacterium PBBC1]
MPIAPSTIKSTCPKCGWSTDTHNQSDAMLLMPPSVCGRCGGALKEKKLGWAESMLNMFKNK